MNARRCIRPLVAVLTAIATLAPGVVLPVVDAGSRTGRPAAEAQHEPGRCHLAHDHLACVQHASSAPHPEGEAGLPILRPPRADGTGLPALAPLDSRISVLLPHPRAPPTSLG